MSAQQHRHPEISARSLNAVLAAVLGFALTACAPEDSPTNPDLVPSFSGNIGGSGELVLCKYTEFPTSTQFQFEVTATSGSVPDNGNFTLSSVQEVVVTSDCAVVWTPIDGANATVTVTEIVPPGWELDRIFSTELGYIDPVQNPVELTVSSTFGQALFFKNVPAPIDMAPGRMTGGGGQLRVGDIQVSRGFTIHCDITLSNNVEVNWGADHWHLDKPLTSAECVDDPNVDPAPPPAPFDTFIGEGIGRLNDVDGSVIRFTFVDSGEPGGKEDRATIEIWAPGDDPDTDTPILSVDGLLHHGNLQAHFDQPHK